MKLLTFVDGGAYRTGILTTRPGTPDAVVIDTGAAVALLTQQVRRIYWRTPWSGPWGRLAAPRDMLDVVRHGRQAVVALEDLERTLWHVARSLDGAWVETVLRDPVQICWQPPLPEPPLYIFLSGNTQVMAHQRPPNPPWQVPAPRLRPATAVIGHGEPLYADGTGTVSADMELGVVIGPEAAGVDADAAMDFVFGYTICNDTYDRRYQQMTERTARGATVAGVRLGGIATCGKASDGCGPIGPVIVTADEVGSPHDLSAGAWFNERLRVRAHTSAYYYNVRDTVAHFARMMTLPAGSILGMGACGYDGHAVHGPFRRPGPPGTNRLALEFERVGRLEHPIVYADELAPADGRQDVAGRAAAIHDQPETTRHSAPQPSRYLARRAQLGLPAAEQPDLSPADVPARSRSFWALAENHRRAPLPDLPAPYLYPARSLAGGTLPYLVPRHARRLVIACELAGVIGPRPVHGPSPENVPPLVLGFAVVVAVMDMSLVDSYPGRRTDDALRFAAYQCRFGDACSRIGAITPVAGGSAALRDGSLRLTLDRPSRPREHAEVPVADYGVSVEESIAWIANGVTLLPGDVVSLGPSGATVTIPAGERLEPDATICAGIDGLGAVRVPLVDGRDWSAEPWPWPLLQK
jgi:2-keto-4-pentenoate hydratase/2-oxohepta-3-ene-1,7-dioic acid hydratase in catechol pathway